MSWRWISIQKKWIAPQCCTHWGEDQKLSPHEGGQNWLNASPQNWEEIAITFLAGDAEAWEWGIHSAIKAKIVGEEINRIQGREEIPSRSSKGFW